MTLSRNHATTYGIGLDCFRKSLREYCTCLGPAHLERASRVPTLRAVVFWAWGLGLVFGAFGVWSFLGCRVLGLGLLRCW